MCCSPSPDTSRGDSTDHCARAGLAPLGGPASSLLRGIPPAGHPSPPPCPVLAGGILKLPIWGDAAAENCFEDGVYWEVRGARAGGTRWRCRPVARPGPGGSGGSAAGAGGRGERRVPHAQPRQARLALSIALSIAPSRLLAAGPRPAAGAGASSSPRDDRGSALLCRCCGYNKVVFFFPGLCCRVSRPSGVGCRPEPSLARGTAAARRALGARGKVEVLGHSRGLGDKVEARTVPIQAGCVKQYIR